MITDIPSAQDFTQSGIDLFNNAWDVCSNLMRDLNEAEEFDVDTSEVESEYWEASKRRISSSYAMVIQGIELIIKGKIADVSPFLLISGNPREWPKNCDKEDKNYADFKMIDSQDLLRTMNTVCATRSADDFIDRFDKVRRLRNSIVHTVDKRIALTVVQVFEEILWFYKNLGPSESWSSIRYKYLKNDPISKLYHEDHSEYLLCLEYDLLIKRFTKPLREALIGIPKSPRLYICPNCLSYCKSAESELVPKTAFLKPNTVTSKSIFCPVCNEESDIIRELCVNEGCKGNVYFEDTGICLTCGESN